MLACKVTHWTMSVSSKYTCIVVSTAKNYRLAQNFGGLLPISILVDKILADWLLSKIARIKVVDK